MEHGDSDDKTRRILPASTCSSWRVAEHFSSGKLV